MQTKPDMQPQAQPQQAPMAQDSSMSDEMFSEPTAEDMLTQLDNHLGSLPPEAIQIFESGFKEYPKLPEVLGVLMPDAYEYFKTIQTGIMKQNSPAAAPQQASPAGEPAQSPLMGSATPPAKATSAFSGMAG